MNHSIWTRTKKKGCEDWHAEEVAKGEVWNFKNELVTYCESDVKLLKEGCLKFAEDTKRDEAERGTKRFSEEHVMGITIGSKRGFLWRKNLNG